GEGCACFGTCSGESIHAASVMGTEVSDVILRKCRPARSEGLPTKDLCTLRLVLMPDEPSFAQIFPRRIHGDDQCNLLDAQQSLDLLLASNRGMDIPEAFKVDQPVDLVACSEFTLHTLLMFENAFLQIPRHTRIKGCRPIRHYVNVVEAWREIHRSFVVQAFASRRPALLRMTGD